MKSLKLLLFTIIICSLSESRKIDVQFESEEDWLFGHSWGGAAFGSSVDIGSAFVGESEISAYEVVDIDIYLSQHPDSNSVAWTYSAEDTGAVFGLGNFPGTVYDVSNSDEPRRLNLIFFTARIDWMIEILCISTISKISKLTLKTCSSSVIKFTIPIESQPFTLSGDDFEFIDVVSTLNTFSTTLYNLV